MQKQRGKFTEASETLICFKKISRLALILKIPNQVQHISKLLLVRDMSKISAN
jgi:hypothetical protein